MNINAKISLYKPFKKGEPNLPVNEITIEEFCGAVMQDQYVCDQITAIRNEANENKRTKLKRGLPTVTISGTFTQAKNNCLKQHSGFICLDFDGKHNTSVRCWDGLRNELEKVPQILFAALSVSGNGVFAIIPISNPEQHTAHFFSLERDFRRMGLTLDTSCKNVARLRYISHDPEAYWNPKAKVYKKIFEEPKLPKEPVNYEYSGTDELEMLIDAIVKSGKDITYSGDAETHYNNWLTVGVALYAEMGAGGRNAYHAISQHYADYNSGATDKMFDNIANNGYKDAKAGTIFYLAKQAGVKIPRRVKCYLVPFAGIEDYSQKALRIAQDNEPFFIPKKIVMERIEGGLYLPEWFFKEEVMLKYVQNDSKIFEVNH